MIGVYARDDDLLEAVRRDGVGRARVVCVPGVAVVLGKGSRPEVELRIEAIETDGVPVVRRGGGGCSVVLDPGNVIVSVVWPLPGVGHITLAFNRISAWLIEALDRVGVPGVEQKGVSDLVLDDRKIGGSCIRRSLDLVHYATTLLVAPDRELSERYLAHPPREPDYRNGRSHRDFMGALADATGSRDVAAFRTRLEGVLEPTRLTLATVESAARGE